MRCVGHEERMKEIRDVHRGLVRNPLKGRDQLKNLGLNEMIILK
jgi:hypothetical protein